MKKRLNSISRKVATIDTRRGASPVTERIRGYELHKIRERIMLRDEYTCQICGRATVDGEVDHKIPLHLGGAESDENRQWLCKEPCHREKSEREERERA